MIVLFDPKGEKMVGVKLQLPKTITAAELFERILQRFK
jgi:hypothetical protein